MAQLWDLQDGHAAKTADQQKNRAEHCPSSALHLACCQRHPDLAAVPVAVPDEGTECMLLSDPPDALTTFRLSFLRESTEARLSGLMAF